MKIPRARESVFDCIVKSPSHTDTTYNDHIHWLRVYASRYIYYKQYKQRNLEFFCVIT